MVSEPKLPTPEHEGEQPDGTTWRRLKNGRMIRLDRHPEWEEQDDDDAGRYEHRFQFFSLEEISEICALEPAESAEHGYRRGYLDGWVRAIVTMSEMMMENGFTRLAAIDACWDFWQWGELPAWLRGNCARQDWPPRLSPKKKKEGV